MDGIEEIRNTFSKCSIVLNNEGVCAIFMNKTGWIGQSIYTEPNMKTFKSLLNGCDRLVFDFTPSGVFRLVFNFKSDGKVFAIYPPLEHEMTKEEYEALRKKWHEEAVAKRGGQEESDEFYEAFAGVDTKDEVAVIEGFKKLIKIQEEQKLDGYVFDLDTKRQWEEMKKLVPRLAKFQNYFDIEFEDFVPEGGFIELRYKNFKTRNFVISTELKQIFCDLMELTESVDLEVSCENEVCNITFGVS